LIHDLIKPRKFNCVPAVSRGISSALPRWTAEFTKFAAEFVKFCRGKLWALCICIKMFVQYLLSIFIQCLLSSFTQNKAMRVWFLKHLGGKFFQ